MPGTDQFARLNSVLGDRYRLERELGVGGMATVYLAEDRKHRRQVAIKVLDPDVAAMLGPMRFLREIEIASKLDHPNIVPLFDSSQADGFLYFVMPYIQGESLRERLGREKQLPLTEAVQIAREVADALAYAHSRGILHRDIKPENILLAGGHARVADFGIARALTRSSGDRLTATGLAMGTPLYMSPEQLAGEDVDGRSDLYSLGCVLYEMLAGEPPHTGTSAQALFAKRLREPVTPVSVFRENVPRGLDSALTRVLARTPVDRFSTASHFTDALLLEDSADIPRRWTPKSALNRVRTPPVFAFLGVLGIALGAWLVLDKSQTAPSLSPSRVVVFPFHSPAGPEQSEWSEVLMDLVSDAIDGVGEIRRVDPFAVMNRVRRAAIVGSPDVVQAGAIARELGAGRFVLGSAVEVAGTLRASASLYASDDPTEPEHRVSDVRPVEALGEVVNTLARGLLEHVPAGAGDWLASPARLPTESYPALRAFAAGESLLRRARYDSAVRAFRRAVVEDTTFALAWLRLSRAADFVGNDTLMVASADRAVRHSTRLSARDRMLAATSYAGAHGDGAAAERSAVELVSAFPGSVEGWLRLGAARFWDSWQLGRSPMRAEPALERARTLDPYQRQVLHLLGWIAQLNGRRASADSLIEQAWGGPGPYFMLPADDKHWPRFWAELNGASPGKLRVASINTALFTDSLAHALRIAAFLDQESRSDPTRALGRLLQGLIELARGRWRAADDVMARSNVLMLERGWLAALPIFDVDRDRLRVVRDSIASWRPPSSALKITDARAFLLPPWSPHSQRYVLGLLNAQLADTLETRRYADLLAHAVEPADSIGLLQDLAREIRAALAMNAGHPQEALTILDSLELRVASHYQVFHSAVHTRPLARFLRAEALYQMNRLPEALGWYGGLYIAGMGIETVLLAPANVRMGDINERLGDPAQARYHYQRFVTRWKDSDSEYQPRVREVSDRIEGLRRGSR